MSTIFNAIYFPLEGKPVNLDRVHRYRLMNEKLIVVALLLIAAVPIAQAQKSRVSKADAEKVVTIIMGDKAKTQDRKSVV